jgi:HEAT repeat protein
VNSAELFLPSPYYRVLPRQLMRNLRFGSDQLIALLHGAARSVAQEYPGSIMWLGNIGRRGGGDIPYSVSHNSGRDADIAFYFNDAKGQPIAPPDLLSVGRDLTALWQGGTYVFDVPRNWALVRSLIEYPYAQIQHLFIASWLKSALLDHAREQGEDPDLIARASELLGQPGRSNPHNDHLHVRIYCSQGDVERGCLPTGRVHSWVETFEHARRERLEVVRSFLSDDDAEQRARAAERLVVMSSQDDASAIAQLLGDDEPRVRAAAARAVGALGTRAEVERLVDAAREEEDAEVLEAIIDGLATLGGDDAEDYLMELLAEERMVGLREQTVDLRALACDALGRTVASRAVPSLIGLVDAPNAYLRARAHWALARITNAQISNGWADAQLDAASLATNLAAWEHWRETAGRGNRGDWLVSGFMRAGLLAPEDDLRLAVLAQAADAADLHLSYNAQRLLMHRLRTANCAAGGDARYWRQRASSAVGPRPARPQAGTLGGVGRVSLPPSSGRSGVAAPAGRLQFHGGDVAGEDIHHQVMVLDKRQTPSASRTNSNSCSDSVMVARRPRARGGPRTLRCPAGSSNILQANEQGGSSGYWRGPEDAGALLGQDAVVGSQLHDALGDGLQVVERVLIDLMGVFRQAIPNRRRIGGKEGFPEGFVAAFGLGGCELGGAGDEPAGEEHG